MVSLVHQVSQSLDIPSETISRWRYKNVQHTVWKKQQHGSRYKCCHQFSGEYSILRLSDMQIHIHTRYPQPTRHHKRFITAGTSEKQSKKILQKSKTKSVGDRRVLQTTIDGVLDQVSATYANKHTNSGIDIPADRPEVRIQHSKVNRSKTRQQKTYSHSATDTKQSTTHQPDRDADLTLGSGEESPSDGSKHASRIQHRLRENMRSTRVMKKTNTRKMMISANTAPKLGTNNSEMDASDRVRKIRRNRINASDRVPKIHRDCIDPSAQIPKTDQCDCIDTQTIDPLTDRKPISVTNSARTMSRSHRLSRKMVKTHPNHKQTHPAQPATRRTQRKRRVISAEEITPTTASPKAESISSSSKSNTKSIPSSSKSNTKSIPSSSKSNTKSIPSSSNSNTKSISSSSNSNTKSIPSSSKSTTKSMPSSSNSNTKSIPSSSNSNTKSIPSSSKSNTKSIPSSSNSNTKSIPSSSNSNTKSIPSSSKSNTKSIPSSSKSNTKSVPSSSNFNTKSIPSSSNSNTKSIPSSSNSNTKSIPSSSKSTTKSIPSTSNSNTKSIPSSSNLNTKSNARTRPEISVRQRRNNNGGKSHSVSRGHAVGGASRTNTKRIRVQKNRRSETLQSQKSADSIGPESVRSSRRRNAVSSKSEQEETSAQKSRPRGEIAKSNQRVLRSKTKASGDTRGVDKPTKKPKRRKGYRELRSVNFKDLKKNGLSTRLYTANRLKQAEYRGYKSAGVLFYHLAETEQGDKDVHLLLAIESDDYFKRSRGARYREEVAGALTLMGGKRAPLDRNPLETASRELKEESAGLLRFRTSRPGDHTAVTWNPVAKYALYIKRAEDTDLEVPKKYRQARIEAEERIQAIEKDVKKSNSRGNTTMTLSKLRRLKDQEAAEMASLVWTPLKKLLSTKAPKVHPYLLQPILADRNFVKFLKGLGKVSTVQNNP